MMLCQQFTFILVLSVLFALGRTFNAFRVHVRMHALQMGSGLHGQGFRFLPIFQGKRSEHYPRIIQIAGVYPEMSPEALLAPMSTPAAKPGTWSYDFSDPEGPQLGTIAIPGSDIVTTCLDPVAIILQNKDLGVSFVEDVEMVAVVDRADKKFNPDNFYVFKTPDHKLKIQWTDSIEIGYTILGKVVLVLSPWVEGMKKPSTGFLEEDEDDE